MLRVSWVVISGEGLFQDLRVPQKYCGGCVHVYLPGQIFRLEMLFERFLDWQRRVQHSNVAFVNFEIL